MERFLILFIAERLIRGLMLRINRLVTFIGSFWPPLFVWTVQKKKQAEWFPWSFPRSPWEPSSVQSRLIVIPLHPSDSGAVM